MEEKKKEDLTFPFASVNDGFLKFSAFPKEVRLQMAHAKDPQKKEKEYRESIH